MKRILLGILIMIVCITNVYAEEEVLGESVIEDNVSNAECDYKKENANTVLANKVNYTTSYNKVTRTFTVTFYNVVPEIYLNYKNNIYAGDYLYNVKISEIPEGEDMKVSVASSSTNCTGTLMNLYVNLPYYNDFYGSIKCEEYKEILNVCKVQFLDYQMTDIILDNAIKNYNSQISNTGDIKESGDKTFLQDIGEFVMSWGVKIILALATIGLSIWLYKVKLRKVKHGI